MLYGQGDSYTRISDSQRCANGGQKIQKFLTDIGVAESGTSMNEPASFHGELPSDVVFTDEDQKSTHAAMHNVYGHLMSVWNDL